MKIVLLYLCLISIAIKSNAQLHQKKIDYQYSRSEQRYVGYTLSVDTLAKHTFVEFATNERVKKIATLWLITGTEEIELPFVDNKLQISNDDSSLHLFNLKIDFPAHLKPNANCNSMLRFVVTRKLYFDLPLNLCVLQGHLHDRAVNQLKH